jgi:hypothetical protein
MYWMNSIPKEKVHVDNAEVYSIEFKTEMTITGIGSARNSNLLVGPTVESLIYGTTDLKTYELKLSYRIDSDAPEKRIIHTKKGYYHPFGVSGELGDLLSIFFHTRIYVTTSSQGQLTENSIRSRQVKKVIRGNIPRWYINHIIQPNQKNFLDFIVFLESLEKLPKSKHQQFINACTNYNLALQQIGISNDMAFVRLVSAIESISNNLRLTASETSINTDLFNDILKNVENENQKLELKEIFQARKSTQKFKRFIEKYSSNYLATRTNIQYGKINDDNIDTVLSRVYRARSNYLHTGTPMFISEHWEDGKMDMDSTTGMGIGSKWFSEGEKIPTLEFFEGLTRHCIVSYLEENTIKN